MEGAGDQLFPSAGFSEDQDVGVGRRHHLKLPQNTLQGSAVATISPYSPWASPSSASTFSTRSALEDPAQT
jgi:hypothetical protein